MRPPNILLIVTDQQRLETLRCFGNSDIKTPHLDALADESARFGNCYCPYPVCVPSRTSIVTGLYAHQHTVISHATCAPGLPTFPKTLGDAGYRTHAIGKMHMRPTYLDVGIERLELAEQHGDGRFDDDYHRELREADLVDAIDVIDQRTEFREHATDEYFACFGAIPSNLPEKWHHTTWIGDRAVAAAEQLNDNGEFLMVSFVKPHHPFDPPQPWDNMYDPDALTLLPGWTDATPAHDLAYHGGYFDNASLTEPVLRQAMAYYYATISQIDHHVGRIIDVLKRRGLYDDTLIIFTSDHGEYLGYHHQLLKSAYPYEPLARVPLLMRQPGGVGAGARDDLVNLVDLAPTILTHAGCDIPAVMPGRNLADTTTPARDMVFQQFRANSFLARSRRYKLLLTPPHKPSFFYDLDNDPCEMNNLIDEPAHADEVERHRRAIADWLMFEAPTVPRVDDHAPQIDGPNVPPHDEARRAEVQRWFFDKAKPWMKP